MQVLPGVCSNSPFVVAQMERLATRLERYSGADVGRPRSRSIGASCPNQSREMYFDEQCDRSVFHISCFASLHCPRGSACLDDSASIWWLLVTSQVQLVCREASMNPMRRALATGATGERSGAKGRSRHENMCIWKWVGTPWVKEENKNTDQRCFHLGPSLGQPPTPPPLGCGPPSSHRFPVRLHSLLVTSSNHSC